LQMSTSPTTFCCTPPHAAVVRHSSDTAILHHTGRAHLRDHVGRVSAVALSTENPSPRSGRVADVMGDDGSSSPLPRTSPLTRPDARASYCKLVRG
jgi:hypothetical protein